VPNETRRVPSSDGVSVALHDLGGTGGALLISHATGFHGRCYLPVAHELASRFHSLALDYRGHGDTSSPRSGLGLPLGIDIGSDLDWESYGDDAEGVALSLERPLFGFGHSMGGAALLMAAHRQPDLFQRLVLFEPIVFPPMGIRPGGEGDSPLVAGARRRRSSFPSYEAAIANFSAKPPLSSFTQEALDAYVRFGFAEGEDGQVHLKCRPETEAATFVASGGHHMWDALPEIVTPVLVLAGRVEEMQPSSISSSMADRLPNGVYRECADLDHFGPMTHPAEVARLIQEFLELS
jgi:pimeloyl-ACP methyl ester carboxylesterase